MPAPAPIPRGPTVLTLYTAADLLTGPGCPACRYAGEAADRYLGWFALEAHADAVTITRLCSSLGMCPPHTRGLMRQPGAAHRLTAVYRYVMGAARDRLDGHAGPVAACPACLHDRDAVRRALDTLLEGLADDWVRSRYRELGGLCIPHLGAASARADRRSVAWLSRAQAAAIAARPAWPRWLAGTDHDADVRAVLRRTAAADGRPGPGSCIACLAAARSADDHLAQILRSGGSGPPDSRLLLCAAHLGDAAVTAGHRDLLPLLAWQVGCLAAAVSPGSASSPLRTRGGPAGRIWPRRRGDRSGACPACLASRDAAQRAVDDLRASLRASHPAALRHPPLCVRHLLGLRARDPRAGQLTARGAVERADKLITELSEAFGKYTWARRHDARGPEMTAWRRAAAFLDGGVFCGCPPLDA